MTSQHFKLFVCLFLTGAWPLNCIFLFFFSLASLGTPRVFPAAFDALTCKLPLHLVPAILRAAKNEGAKSLQSRRAGFDSAVTVFWVCPCFGYPRTQNTSVLGIPLQYFFSVLGIPRYPPPVPRSLVFWASLTVLLHFWY